MKKIAISKFKATCLGVLEQVAQTGHPVLVTRRGEPIAEIMPPLQSRQTGGWLGSMQGSLTISGNIVGNSELDNEWEALTNNHPVAGDGL